MDGWAASKQSLQAPSPFFLPWPHSSRFARQFSVFAQLHLEACSQNRFRVYRKFITGPNIEKKKKKKKKKRLLFLKENLVKKECLTFSSQPLPAQPSVSGPMVSFLAALAEMAALAWPPFLPAVLALGSKYQQVTLVFLFSAVILIPP